MDVKLSIDSIKAVYDGALNEYNIKYQVFFFGDYVFSVEVPANTEPEEVEDAVRQSLFSARVRGMTEAYLSHE